MASTTGNITGIYDMNGGASEMVAGYLKDGNLTESGFIDYSNIVTYVRTGYIELYDSNTNQHIYNKRILGDATGEMGPFYNYYDADGNLRPHNSWHCESSQFPTTQHPWFSRGGGVREYSISGQLYFLSVNGHEYDDIGFRLALTGKTP